MAERVRIVPYDPGWAAAFERERRALLTALGTAAVANQHVGSTAVADMPAKPVIDILVELETYPPTCECIATLASIGYEHMGESGVPGRHWFRKGVPRTHHVHAVPVGGAVGLRLMALRDWLTRHPDDARAYAEIKRAAAARHGDDIDSAAYAREKTCFIEDVLTRAGQT